MTSEWLPFSERATEGSEKFKRLHEGVPEWLKPRLIEWVESFLVIRDEEGFHRVEDAELLHHIGIKLRLEPALAFHRSGATGARIDLLERCREDEALFLNVLDILVSLPFAVPKLAELNRWLDEGGSIYTLKIRDRKGYLERRVEESVATAAEEVMDAPGNASRHLKEAWHNVYGVNPNPNFAYPEAIKAVEAAAIPVICPNDKTATLGRIKGRD